MVHSPPMRRPARWPFTLCSAIRRRRGFFARSRVRRSRQVVSELIAPPEGGEVHQFVLRNGIDGHIAVRWLLSWLGSLDYCPVHEALQLGRRHAGLVALIAAVPRLRELFVVTGDHLDYRAGVPREVRRAVQARARVHFESQVMTTAPYLPARPAPGGRRSAEGN